MTPLSPHTPDLESLETLLAVAETGSFGQVATQRRVSQPAISARIRRLEQLVGIALIERGPRGSALTRSGALVAEWARDVVAAAQILDAGIASLRGDHDSRLRVAASLTVAEHLMPRWLVRFATRHPDTTVSLTAINSTEVVRALVDGTADLGFVEGPRMPPQLDGRIVARDRLVVVAPPTHPWARRRKPISAAELVATRLVSREPTSGTRTALAAALAAYGPIADPLLELSTVSGVLGAVAAGAGPAVVSLLSVTADLAGGRVVEVPFDEVDLGRRLRVVWPRGQRPTGPARDLLTIALSGVEQ